MSIAILILSYAIGFCAWLASLHLRRESNADPRWMDVVEAAAWPLLAVFFIAVGVAKMRRPS